MNKNLENGIIKTVPKSWSDDEIKNLCELKLKGFNNQQIGEIMGRSEVSIAIKYKRIHKRDDTYNSKHRIEKYKSNDLFIDMIKPSSLLDVFAGESYYKNHGIKTYITNDKDFSKETNYHHDAFEFLALFYNKSFDVVDLDPFGSAFDCFDLAIKIAEKGLIITLGEIGHRRFKRLDFVRDRYGINDISEDWIGKMIEYIIKRGKIYKKTLNVVIVKDFGNIARVYFTVKQEKEFSQWKK